MKKSIGAKTWVIPTPVWVVGTYDSDGKPNVMTAAWGGVCCSRPPCVYVSLREATYTHGNIMDRRAFTVSIPSEDHISEADYFGMISGRDQDKLKIAGLTPVKSNLVDAPFVEEFPLVLECKVIKIVEIGLHTQFIGEILDVKAEESVINTRDAPAIEAIKPAIYSPGDRGYNAIGRFLGPAYTLGKEISK